MTDEKKSTKQSESIFSRFLENNKRAFVFSIIVAVVCWCIVSMFQTQDTEKVIKNVRVQLALEGSLPYNNGLEIFGEQDYFADVTVRGKSYLINDSSITDEIALSASLSSVSTAGTYNLPITYSVKNNNIEITNISKTYITVYFDEMVTKEFDLVEEVKTGDNYKIADGYKASDPTLSVDKITLKGPALEINRITSVKAVATIDKELTENEAFEATIVPVGSAENIDFSHVTKADDTKVYININLTASAEVTPIVTFTNAPKSYRDTPIEYTITPDTVKMSVNTGDNKTNNGQVSVGSIDFKDINNTVNTFTFKTSDANLKFEDNVEEFTVTIDASKMAKRWMEVSVEAGDVELPEGAEIVTKSIQSVQIVGPEASVMPITSSEAYAVPNLDGIELKQGENTVPAKIVLKTLTDSWVRGDYTIVINVK